MDPISYGVAAKQKQRLERVIANPDSTSGVVTVPKTIASGENITVPAGRVAVLPNVQVDGTLNVQGDVFIPSGATLSGVVEKVTSTDNAVVRFNGTTGDVQNSGVVIDDNGNVGMMENSVVKPNIVNTNMVFRVSPSGTANFSSFTGYNSSDINNTHFGQIAVRSDSVTIDSSKVGTGTFKPLKIGIGGSYPIVIDEGNNLSLGTGVHGVKVVLPDAEEMIVIPTTTASNVRISATASDYSSLPSWMSTSLLQYGSTASGNYITGVPKANLGALWAQNITNLVIGSNSSSPLIFVNSTTEKMRIDTAGNVGIGTASPNSKLHIAGTNQFEGMRLATSYNSGEAVTFIDSTNSSNIADSHIFFKHETDGSSRISFGTTPAGSKYSDRRVETVIVDGNGNLLVTNSTGGLGYGTGSGGTVTQLTSKSTAVTLNKPTGQIAMNNAALAAGASVEFQFNNNLISTADSLYITFVGSPSNNYSYKAKVVTGAAYIVIKNESTWSLSETVQLNFTLIKGAIA